MCLSMVHISLGFAFFIESKLSNLSNKVFILSIFQHGVLKPFMLRRVKKDVISEMTAKTEVTVRCTLSSRQNAFYQAIKNKISLSELINVSRGGLSDKKILNLMNIVIQLRKV